MAAMRGLLLGALGALLALLALAGASQAAEYWAVSLPNTEAGSPPDPAYQPVIALTDASGAGGTATILSPTGATSSVTVPAGATVTVPMTGIVTGSSLGKAAWKVTTTGELAVSQFNGVGPSLAGDGTRLVAGTELGKTYRVLSYSAPLPGLTGPGSPARNFVTIVGTQATTTITVTTPVATEAGPGVAAFAPGVPKTFTLGVQDVLNIESGGPGAGSQEGDLTGTTVVSDKPVAVFAGLAEGTVGSSDLDAMSEAMPPEALAGKHFVVCGSQEPRDGTDTLRILATSAATTVFFDPPIPVPAMTLTAGQSKDVTGLGDVELTSDKPVLVAQYMGESSDQADEAPAMVAVAPVSEWYTNARMFAPAGWTSYASVAAPKTATVTIDATPVATWRNVGTSDYRCATGPVGAGTHSLTASAPSGFAIFGFGSDTAYWMEAGRADLKCSENPPPLASPVLAIDATGPPGLVQLEWSGAAEMTCPPLKTNIYRKVDGGFWPATPLATVPMPGESYNDTVEDNCATWVYKVRFEDAFGEGPDSNEATYTYPDFACDPDAGPPDPGPGSGQTPPGSIAEPGPNDEPDGDGIDDAEADHDTDEDGVRDRDDLCPLAQDPDQDDLDADRYGDACDGDDDGDRIADLDDRCPRDHDPLQLDLDQDGEGDVCDPDVDGDDVKDEADNCPQTANADQKDEDEDGVGDACQLQQTSQVVPTKSSSTRGSGPATADKSGLAPRPALPGWAVPSMLATLVFAALIFLVGTRLHRRKD